MRRSRVESRFIQKLKRYALLTERDVALLDRLCAQTRDVPGRRDLVREGDKPGPFLIFMSGWGCRYKLVPNGQRQVVALLMPGDSCDIHADALVEMDHTISVITPATIATISRAEMDDVIKHHPHIVQALYVSQLVDEGTTRAWIVSMGRRSSIERVAHLMCELYLRAQNVGLTTDHTMLLPLTQTLLADCLGMTAVHINRVLRDLREVGAMEISRGSLRITNPDQLVRIAGFDENYLHRRLQQAA